MDSKTIIKIERVFKFPDAYSAGPGIWIDLIHYSDGTTLEVLPDIEEITKTQGNISIRKLFNAG